ncbi:glycosyltransferase [Chitinophaga sp. SYP-B3965]|uniref:glycosyltransferase n=1 Tax=Chitinophaga sp. SYP-B3965 TaxID=2663120 RepID=UPI001299C764|nr:glycosyltransferase [Chitinophaga sp. SYP-B3965]MRG44060.1 glycosyltransferase [Chitinophaga sp. SYP-B3965]
MTQIHNKKIVIIGPAHPLRGGLASFNERLARQLTDQGNKVSIHTFSFQYPGFMFPGKTQYADGPAPAGLDIQRTIHSMNPLNWLKTGRKIKKERPDIVIIAYWLPIMAPALGSIANIIRKNKHSQIIGLVHNLIPHEKRPGDKPFTRYFVNQCDAFITLSKEVLADIKQLTDKPVAYSPHPVYDNFGDAVAPAVAKQHLGWDANNRYLLFFGFIRAYKGLDLLLEAFADPRLQAIQNLQLVVAGEFYEDRKKYDHLITEKVKIFSDFIPNEEVKYYFSAADLIVQPYRTATQSGISQMAYHFEKPMLVTAVGGLPEIVPDGKAGYVVALDATAIADGILRFLAQPPDVFSSFIREQKQLYSWEHFADSLGSLTDTQ